MHASSPTLIAGTEHLVPTLVIKCVEELYRTGQLDFFPTRQESDIFT